MKVLATWVMLVLAALPGCASMRAGRDALCAPLRAFAESVGPDETRSIVFHTQWGSNFRDDPDPAIFAKRCDHGDYDPGKAVCAYLFSHGAVEFSGGNVERTIACLGTQTRFGPDVELHTGLFSIGYGTPDRGSHITVEFTEDPKLGGKVLRIEADGY